MKRPAAGLRSLSGALLLAAALNGVGQGKSDLQPSPPIPLEEGRRQARELLGNLLKLRPAENTTGSLVVNVTDRDDVTRAVPVTVSVVLTPTNFLNIYQTTGGPDTGSKLSIAHTDGQPNEYWLSQPPDASPRRLAANALMTSFAGSDFWCADLGLEFLHWPEQRIVKKQMRKNLFCAVLESLNRQPAGNGYSRVVSWVAANRPDDIVIVHADAYDAKGKLLKQFDPKKVRKVNGAWELAEMEIFNRQTRSTTRIEFDPGSGR